MITIKVISEIVPDPAEIEEDLEEILKELGYIITEGGPSESPFLFEIIEVMVVLVLAVIVMYCLFYIINRSPRLTAAGGFERKRGKERIEKELIHKKNYTALYKKAVDLGKNRQYGEAVRVLYMALLILLDTHHLVEYHPSLTNYEYRKKVRTYSFSHLFDKVTRIFDVVYYGGKWASGEDFAYCVQAFTEIKEAVS